MDITLADIITWLIVGALGGSLVGGILGGEKKGYTFWTNMFIGLVGALIGGLLVTLLNLFPDLEKVSVSLRDVAAALIGAIIFLIVRGIVKKKKKAA